VPPPKAKSKNVSLLFLSLISVEVLFFPLEEVITLVFLLAMANPKLNRRIPWDIKLIKKKWRPW
jgi:hypothetical protein